MHLRGESNECPPQTQQALNRDEDNIDERFGEKGSLSSWELNDRLFREDPDQFLELMSTMQDWVSAMHDMAEDHIKISRRGPIRGKRLVFDYAMKAGLGLRKIA
ncbi:MAG: hypothetical protein J7M40_18795 [Planctomycetes bacterium]|nr:hypothetical protein [Planctomycetota bacterium]